MDQRRREFREQRIQCIEEESIRADDVLLERPEKLHVDGVLFRRHFNWANETVN